MNKSKSSRTKSKMHEMILKLNQDILANINVKSKAFCLKQLPMYLKHQTNKNVKTVYIYIYSFIYWEIKMYRQIL